MAYLNQVNLIGNVGSEPEIREFDKNKVAFFKVATTERFRDRNNEKREQTQWHSCVAGGTIAEVCEKYLHKGAQVFIGGKLTYRTWKDKEGNDHYATEVRVYTVQMLDRKPKMEPVTQDDDLPDFPF